MFNDHAKLGVATIVFYVPAVAMSAYLLFHRHQRPRMAWYFLFTFSLGDYNPDKRNPGHANGILVRVASGVVTILYERKPADVGILIAAIILLGVGVMPLIAVTIGMLRIMYATLFIAHAFLLMKCQIGLRPTSPRTVCILRLLFFAGASLPQAWCNLSSEEYTLDNITAQAQSR
jgi:hypothetical protein